MTMEELIMTLRGLQAQINAKTEEREQMMTQLTRNNTQSFVDNKALGKPGIFKSTEETWPNFYFKLTNWLVSMIPELEQAIDYMEEQTSEIDNYRPFEVLGLTHARAVPVQIYTVIANLCEGESVNIIKNVTKKNGFEVLRRLLKRWDPMNLGRRRYALVCSSLATCY